MSELPQDNLLDRDRLNVFERTLIALCHEHGWSIVRSDVEENRLELEVRPEWNITLRQRPSLRNRG